jgi:uncharacterized protein (DUF433 family)
MAQAGEIYPGVVVDPEIIHGKPVIAGTRIPVALVLGQCWANWLAESPSRNWSGNTA